MNVLFLIHNYPGFGGIEKVTTLLSAHLQRVGFTVSILAFVGNAPELRKETASGITVDYFPYKGYEYTPENAAFATKYFDEGNYDYIIFQDSYADTLWLFDKIDYPWQDKLIVTEHNTPSYSLISLSAMLKAPCQSLKHLVKKFLFPVYYYRALSFQRKRHTRLLSCCKTYVLLSSSYRKDIHTLCGNTYDDKIVAITNPLTIAPTNTQDFPKKKQVLFVGRLTGQKGLNYLLDIWKGLRLPDDDPWELKIAGRGEQEASIKQRIQREHIPHVSLLGAVQNMAPLYEESSILIMTSVFEGFGLVLTEAMSRGCVPMAFASFGAVYDIIDDGINGILVSPYKVKDYVMQLRQLMTDSPGRARLSDAALQKSNRFRIENVGEHWLKLLTENTPK